MIHLAAIVMQLSRRLLLGISLYAVSLVALAIPWLQRHVLYLHRAQWPTWWADANKPEQFGFAKNQVTPFTFTTPDHETIHSWHIIPLSLYTKHEFEILQQQSGYAEDITRVKGFELLRDDPESRLIISFHGNAGNVAQGWRSDSYRVLSNSGTFNTHILAIDYRGFGFSSGSPTEEGLIIDGIAAVNWAMEVAQVSPDRIVILGHSLGTAVTAAVVEHFAVQGIEFAGTILLSGFARLHNLLSEFCLVGWLFPLRVFPPVLRYFKTRLRDTWSSTERIANFVRVSKRVRLFVVHSLNDPEILPHHADELFDAAVNATVDGGLDIPQLEEIKQKNTIDMGDGAFTRTVRSNSDSIDKIIRQDIVLYGYHSLILTYNQVSLAVLKAFELNGEAFDSV